MRLRLSDPCVPLLSAGIYRVIAETKGRALQRAVQIPLRIPSALNGEDEERKGEEPTFSSPHRGLSKNYDIVNSSS